MYKLHIQENNECGGFYKDGIHCDIPYNCITINTALWQYLLSLVSFKLKENINLENRIYTINDKDLFEKIITIPNEPPDSQPTIADRLAFLESEHITNVSSILDLDFRVTDIEFTIESPMTMNLKTIKGEIKTMARTPYEMMKILIIAGEYDEADMTHKINRYYEMKKITLEQKEELLGLIEANKVIE